jgi:hypothetical protein
MFSCEQVGHQEKPTENTRGHGTPPAGATSAATADLLLPSDSDSTPTPTPTPVGTADSVFLPISYHHQPFF